MLIKGLNAEVFRARAIAGTEGVGFGIEIEDGAAHTTLVLRHADGSALGVRLDDDAIERLCEAMAIIVEHGNAVLMRVGNDQ